MKNNLTTIIIPIFNNLEYTKACIKSIYDNTEANTFKIIVFDNGSQDDTNRYLENIKNEYNNFDFIRSETNLGFAIANNLAAKQADTEKILFLNNDTLVTKNWLKLLVQELDNSPMIKIAGSKLIYQDNTIQHAGIVISNHTYENKKIVYHLYNFFDYNHFSVNKKRFFQAVTGACMLTYQDFFFELGGFDERYLNGFEDIDFCLQAGEKNAQIVYVPESIVYHFESKTKGRHDKTSENTNLFYQKWQNKLVADDYKYYQEDGFNLLNVKKYWQPIEKKIIDQKEIIFSQERMELLIEKNQENQVIKNLILIKSENELKDTILKIQYNTLESFNIIIVSDNQINNNFSSNFTHIKLFMSNDFKIKDLEQIIINQQYQHIIIINDLQQIDYNWSFKTKKYLINNDLKLVMSLNEKISLLYLDFLENIKNFFLDDYLFILFLNNLYITEKRFKDSIHLLEKSLEHFPNNNVILNNLANSLYNNGDINTAKKIKAFLKK
ncbi:MAG: glycosyltransferase [Candidatus Sericytochromatia bacterium]|nr:glycosyltransferase [Candidatus Sericytochromatia bacterium]